MIIERNNMISIVDSLLSIVDSLFSITIFLLPLFMMKNNNLILVQLEDRKPVVIKTNRVIICIPKQEMVN